MSEQLSEKISRELYEAGLIRTVHGNGREIAEEILTRYLPQSPQWQPIRSIVTSEITKLTESRDAAKGEIIRVARLDASIETLTNLLTLLPPDAQVTEDAPGQADYEDLEERCSHGISISRPCPYEACRAFTPTATVAQPDDCICAATFTEWQHHTNDCPVFQRKQDAVITEFRKPGGLNAAERERVAQT